jgi:acetoin utilization deacetylase AcuC-like enzyme
MSEAPAPSSPRSMPTELLCPSFAVPLVSRQAFSLAPHYAGSVLHVVHHPGYVAPPPPGSTFPHDKYGLVMDALRDSSVPMTVHTPEAMPRTWIEAVHDPDYVEEVLSCTVPMQKLRRIGFAITEQVSLRSQLSPGGTWMAAQLALRHGFAANSAGGSHHALADTGAGYCIFNDLAITANRLIAERQVSRILILDLDVHQGDGTASLTAGRDDIFTLSIHAEKNFPHRKAQSTLDVALPDGAGDAEYLTALSSTLAPAVEGFAPELILLQAGIDAHVNDRLGRLALSDGGLIARDQLVAKLARARGIPIASTLGGGYGADRMAVAERHARSMITFAQQLTS